jgi:heme oxygenase
LLTVNTAIAQDQTPGRTDRGSSLGRLRRSLRAATHLKHQALDRLMIQIDLTQRESYALFLAIHHAALCALQPYGRPADHADFLELITCVRRDLNKLGITSIRDCVADDVQFASGHRLGAAYVVRGSRLGAAVLLARVPALLPREYLSFAPALTWPRFLDEIEAFSCAFVNLDSEVIRGAQCAFEVFGAIAADQIQTA